MHKQKLLAQIAQPHPLIVMGLLICALVIGWQMGKDLAVMELLQTGLMFLISQQ